MSYQALSRRIFLAATGVSLAACAASPQTVLLPLQEPVGPLKDFPRAPLGLPLPAGPIGVIAVTSCANEERPAPLYLQLAAAKPDLALMIGDNVYGSWTSEDPQLSDLRAAYWQMARKPEFKTLVEAVPVMPVWDDHDFGKNDGGGDFPHKALAQQMFNAFWNMPPESPTRQRPGLYRSVMLGVPGQRVQIIILDTRYFRDPLVPTDARDTPGKERYIPHPETATADVLGPAQWTWLEGELRKPADLRIIVSSIQVIADGHGWERWGQFPAVRNRLYRLIGQTGAKGVVFVSGDRHLGAINRIDAGVGYPLHDLTASAINMSSWMAERPSWNNEAGPYRIGPSYTPVNYGLMRIDWAARMLALQVIGLENIVGLEHRVTFAELGLG